MNNFLCYFSDSILKSKHHFLYKILSTNRDTNPVPWLSMTLIKFYLKKKKKKKKKPSRAVIMKIWKVRKSQSDTIYGISIHVYKCIRTDSITWMQNWWGGERSSPRFQIEIQSLYNHLKSAMECPGKFLP
jgi:uncharacterized sodium:solute symporter family permease YidK